MKNCNLKTILLLFTLSIMHSLAQPYQRERPREANKFHPMERLDQDGDQKLSKEEFAKSQKLANLQPEQINMLFSRLDKNKDSFLSLDELSHRRSEKPRKHMNMKELDTDQDGKISLEEFLTRAPREKDQNIERREKLFSFLDRNQDGFLTENDRPSKGERPHHRRPGHTLKDKEKHPPLHEMIKSKIKRLDSNEDGAISFEEFLASERMQNIDSETAKNHFNRMDKNGDGVVNHFDSEAKNQQLRKTD